VERPHHDRKTIVCGCAAESDAFSGSSITDKWQMAGTGRALTS